MKAGAATFPVKNEENFNQILALELCSNRKMSRCSVWLVLQLKAYRPYSRCTYTWGKSCIKKLPLLGRCFPPNVDVFFYSAMF
jgi:hypothetical protein